MQLVPNSYHELIIIADNAMFRHDKEGKKLLRITQWFTIWFHS